MELITERDLIRNVVKAWRKQYPKGCSVRNDKILYKLECLDRESATSKDVEKIIGNNSWTSIRCNECYEYTDAAVQLGEEPDYESATAMVCKNCLLKAIALIGM
jgi:hypothetical protein